MMRRWLYHGGSPWRMCEENFRSRGTPDDLRSACKRSCAVAQQPTQFEYELRALGKTGNTGGSWFDSDLSSMIRKDRIGGMDGVSTSRIENGRRTRWYAKRVFGLT
jgi:hypothetical protein